jgi:hypothetical protein
MEDISYEDMLSNNSDNFVLEDKKYTRAHDSYMVVLNIHTLVSWLKEG